MRFIVTYFYSENAKDGLLIVNLSDASEADR